MSKSILALYGILLIPSVFSEESLGHFANWFSTIQEVMNAEHFTDEVLVQIINDNEGHSLSQDSQGYNATNDVTVDQPDITSKKELTDANWIEFTYVTIYPVLEDLSNQDQSAMVVQRRDRKCQHQALNGWRNDLPSLTGRRCGQ